MIKKGDKVIVDIDKYNKVKEFGNFCEISSRAKNEMIATVTGYNYKRGYLTLKFEDDFICGIYESALKIKN